MPYANVSLVRLLLLVSQPQPSSRSDTTFNPGHSPTLSRLVTLHTTFFCLFGTSRYSTWVAQVRVFFSSHGLPFFYLFYTGWLFLFAVLMAAGLLFTMVFFVRLSLI
jgi:hypothetical protein